MGELMRAVLVGPTIEENLSIAYLASALRQAGHEAKIISFVRDTDAPAVAGCILAEQPQLVGLSMTFQSRGRGFLASGRWLCGPTGRRVVAWPGPWR